MRPSLVALTLALLLPLPGMAADVVVGPGETLSEIADRHGISLSRLMQLNGIQNPDHIEAGQRLRLPGGSSQASGGSRGGGSSRAGGTVVVQPGETLSEIADREGIGLGRLMQINGIQDPDLVQAGQSLRLRGGSTTTATAAAPTYPRGASSHTVRPGESLSEIADGYGVSVSRLVAINGIEDPDQLMSGTRLRLSGSPAAAPTPKPRPQTPVTVAPSRPAATVRPVATTVRPQTAMATTTARSTTMPARSTVPAATGAATGVATGVAAAATSGSRSDWRSYGPLQVDWANWQPMGGSYVAPTLNRDGAPLYMAINCGARKLNATTPSGQWKSWDEPQSDDEQQLIRDLCTTRSN
jgi:LysM repeat protein